MKKIESLFHAAFECQPEERDAFLHRACEGDETIEREVRSLLIRARDAGSFLEAGAFDPTLDLTRGEETGAATGPDPLVGKTVSHYRIEEVLGAGGMGIVYRATDTRLGRTVAIKVLAPGVSANPAFRRRFLYEARAASAVNHPNLVVLYDIASHEGADFLVMEYVLGQTLRGLIPAKGMPLARLAGLGSQIALALGAAHGAGIVHRDIKPANILVMAQQQVKVLDFGIAKMPRDETATHLTRLGEVIGTVAYMSPEQTRGDEVDFRSDIFSLGCVLYEAATGCRPFHAQSTLALMHEIATNDPEPLGARRPDLPLEFSRLVMRCLAKAPAQRPESAMELATELKALTLPEQAPARSRPGLPSLAVIPLHVRGPADDQYLSVSLAEALIHRLSSTRKFHVRPVASVMRFAGKEVDWAAAAQALNVDLLVEGAVQISGGKIRVLVQTHRASDSQMLAAIKQDGDSSDLFGLQDRLADAVSQVFLPIPERSHEHENRAPAVRHPVAFESYLRAVARQVHVDKFDMASAIEMLTRATELDPGFADAWGLLAQACAQMGAHLDSDPKWFNLGEHAIAKTLELDPVQCDALCARSVILWSPSRGFQNRAALRALNAALKIDPMRPTARHQRCAVLWHMGFLDAADADAEELDPVSPVLSVMHKGAIALQRGDFDLSEEYYARALSLEPGGVLSHLIAPIAPLWAGRLAVAQKAVDKAREMFPRESFTVGLRAILAGVNGNLIQAESLADEAIAIPQSLTHTHHTWHSCAAAYALCGKWERAMAELKRCAELGLPGYRLFVADPYLRSLRGHPDFESFLTGLRIEHDAIRDEFGLATTSA